MNTGGCRCSLGQLCRIRLHLREACLTSCNLSACMDHQTSADLLALGSHCSVPECQQIDFLPFTCDCCGEVFCLRHRTYQSHSCPKANSRNTSTIVCPICAKAVKLTDTDDPNEVFERHTQIDCDPANYAKVHQRPKCPAKGCREKLGAVNAYTCKECSTQVCLKHRFPEAHQCQGKKGNVSTLYGHSLRSNRVLEGPQARCNSTGSL